MQLTMQRHSRKSAAESAEPRERRYRPVIRESVLCASRARSRIRKRGRHGSGSKRAQSKKSTIKCWLPSLLRCMGHARGGGRETIARGARHTCDCYARRAHVYKLQAIFTRSTRVLQILRGGALLCFVLKALHIVHSKVCSGADDERRCSTNWRPTFWARFAIYDLFNMTRAWRLASEYLGWKVTSILQTLVPISFAPIN